MSRKAPPKSGPQERRLRLPAGEFRVLEWSGDASRTAVFLHGLSGVADVWTDTIDALGSNRPRCIAMDQRGHGQSPMLRGHYGAGDNLGDLIALVDSLDTPVDLVGHSMGARIAILGAARFPDRFTSASVVDIGPEAWKANIASTTRLFQAIPKAFASREEALAVGRYASRSEDAAIRFVEDRLCAEPDGRYTWRTDWDGLVEMVTAQRTRNYWHDWERLAVPSLLIRGGASDELRPKVAAEMLRRNIGVRFVEFADIGHNIPLLAPELLANELRAFWS